MIFFQIVSDVIVDLWDFGDVVFLGLGVEEVFLQFGPSLENNY